MALLQEIHVFLNIAEHVYMQQTQPISILKSIICWKYSFQKLTQLSLGNNAIDTAAFNTDGFLSRDTFVPAT
jgi:hypothetical protein